MDYQETLAFLYSQLPMYQRVGPAAYRKDLTNTIRLLDALGNPHQGQKYIHIAGTNGKGSTSHMLAALLQQYGLNTGLYTSPHLKSFTERIRINGKEVEQMFVVDFVERIRSLIPEIQPSFFEITVAMAFDYFKRSGVDIAVIETGLGGRLDSTNVIMPLLSLITNISQDHADLLGNTDYLIAREKAGIIKTGIPAIIGEYRSQTAKAFLEKRSDIIFADRRIRVESDEEDRDRYTFYRRKGIILKVQLENTYQALNLPLVIEAAFELEKNFPGITRYLGNTILTYKQLTGLKGRWQQLSLNPTIICDVAHNEAGVKQVVSTLRKQSFENLYIVWGMVKDKKIKPILSLLPKEANYYFCSPAIDRGLEVEELQRAASETGLHGENYSTVPEAIQQARLNAGPDDLIYIGGSTFVVAEIEEL